MDRPASLSLRSGTGRLRRCRDVRPASVASAAAAWARGARFILKRDSEVLEGTTQSEQPAEHQI